MSSQKTKGQAPPPPETDPGTRNTSGSFNLYNDMKKTKDFQKSEDHLANHPPYYNSDSEGVDHGRNAGPTKNDQMPEYVTINYNPDLELCETVFKSIAEDNQDRINLREFVNACSALGIECDVVQMQEVFMEIDAESKGYISMDDFITFLKPNKDDIVVNVQRKLQMNIYEQSTDEDQSDSSGDNYFEHGVMGEDTKADDGGAPGGPKHSQATLLVSFGPKYTLKIDQEKIEPFLIPGKDNKNAYVKMIQKGTDMAKKVKSGSKVIQVNSFYVTGLSFEEIKQKMSEYTILTLVFKHPDSISRDELPFDPYEEGEEPGQLVIPLLGSPSTENDSKATYDRLKKELPCYPFWQYPILIFGELLTVIFYWMVPILVVLAVAFSAGIIVGFYKLLCIIWDDRCHGWSMVRERHFTGMFKRVGDYLNLLRNEWIAQHSEMSGSTVLDSYDEPSVFASWFVKFSCIKCGDWNVRQVICYMGPLLNKEWVAVFQNREIDGRILEKYQTAELLEEIDPDYKARDSTKRRQKMAKHISKQFGQSTGLKIAKSIQALFYCIYIGPMLVLWMWTAWIRRHIPDNAHLSFSESPARYLRTYIFHSALPVQEDCWPTLRHSPKRDTWRIRVFLTMEDETYSLFSYLITITVMILIFVSTAAYVLQTLPAYEEDNIWNQIEWVVSVCFSIEYGIRILMSRDMWDYFIDLMNMIDFLAVIPFWIEWVSIQVTGGSGGGEGSLLRVIRVIRLARVVRLLKSKRFAEYLAIFSKTLQQSMESFGLLVTIVFLETIIFASLIFVTERGEKDEETGLWIRSDGYETDFKSIPEAAYWCIVTMTTVGYGDQYPISIPGKIVGCITMFTGLLVIALPVIIVGGNFEQVYQDHRKSKELEDKRDKIIEKMNRKELANDALERYERGKRSVIELAMEVNEFLQRPNFLTYDHVKHFLAEDFDSRDRIVAVLRHKHGFAFLPQQIDKYRRFILYESYGKYLRKGNKPKKD